VGALTLMARLVRRGLRRHGCDGVLLAAALMVAAASLTLGLALHGRTAGPFAQTRQLTRGPDVVAAVLPEPRASVTVAQRDSLAALMTDPSVGRTSGPFPMTWTRLSFGRINGAVEVQGRDFDPVAVDQPKTITGSWVRPGHVVLEQAFAKALGAHVGSEVRIGDRRFPVTGIAVTTAMPPYPSVCFVGCTLAAPGLAGSEPGLAWMTRADARSLATRTEPLALIANLSLKPGADVDAFVAAHESDAEGSTLLTTFRAIEQHDDKVIRNERAVLVLGGSLLSLLAIATVAILVGGRLTREIRWVGTLKAVGATPGFVAVTLLLQYLAIAVVATAAGVGLAAAVAPHLDAPSAGLLGTSGGAQITPATAASVLAIIGGLTLVAALGTALRAARASTVSALDEAPRLARRGRVLIALSLRLPVAGLLGLRLIARRPLRSLVAAAGIAVAVCGIVVVILARARLGTEHAHVSGALADPDAARLDAVMAVLTVLLAVLSLVTVIFVASATAAEARSSLAVAQVLGASPIAKLGALVMALALPAALGAAIGLPAGIGLFGALDHSNTSSKVPVLALTGVAVLTVVIAACLAAATSQLRTRHSLVASLQPR
jgi:putative ABC transport system permease protein